MGGRRKAVQSKCLGPRRACAVGHSSTFHRRKVDRKATGGPLYQGRNAPRSPPFALSEAARFCTPAPRLPRGFAFPLRGTADEMHIQAPWLPLTRELSPQATEGENPVPRGAWLP